MPREREITYVVHHTRPDLGVGEVGDVVRGKPPVLQVYWPRTDRYGFYLSTDLRRVPAPEDEDDEMADGEEDDAQEKPPARG